ncbi:hypothetical protein BC826DRAFT_1009152 [Russula brevipes]|nr:hypothetical protein BC826DRAFT_1009152 [Russula brevipes]
MAGLLVIRFLPARGSSLIEVADTFYSFTFFSAFHAFHKDHPWNVRCTLGTENSFVCLSSSIATIFANQQKTNMEFTYPKKRRPLLTS